MVLVAKGTCCSYTKRIVPEDDANRLRRHAENALGGAYDPSRVLPILHRLAKHAEVGSDDALFAHLRLAELLVAKSPWRASIHARKVLALHPGDDRAWAILGLCQALLGHYRFARVAYEGAVRAAPDNPFYAHNLGHLIDVALDSPREALPWLRRARELAPHHPDVVTSLAHAHARLGDFAEARSLLAPLRSLVLEERRRGERKGSSELARLLRWVDREAPEPTRGRVVRHTRHRPASSAGTPSSATGTSSSSSALTTSTSGPAQETGPQRTARKTRPSAKTAFELLVRGLAHLPFSAKQLSRAKALARHLRSRPLQMAGGTATIDEAALAAAIAYAIVYVDQVPLSAGEVAAPFRVSATRVRAAFEILRAELDLIRGDARFATAAR